MDAPVTGKADTKKTAEELYDEIAEREGIDENGDAVSVEDDPDVDEPVLAEDDDDGEIDTETISSDDGPDSPEVEPPETEDAPPVETAGADHDGSLEAPHTWPQEWKDAYNAIESNDVRKAVHEMTGHMNRAFTQRMTELSEMRREQESVTRSLAPHVERLQRAGITPEVAVSRALGWDAHIQADPVQGWLDYGKALGIDANQVLQEAQKADPTRYMTPTERQIMEANQGVTKRLEANERQMQQWIQAQQARAQREQQARATQTLQSFMNAKDETGNLLHPHVELVAGVMTRLIDSNNARDLNEAYTMAAANNPQIKAARDKIRKAAQVRGAQQRANKVRKASKSGIVAKGGGKAKAVKTFEQKVSDNYDKIANG